MVRVTLSAPISWISLAELESTWPATDVPSRMVTVAFAALAGATPWFAHEQRNEAQHSVVKTKRFRITLPSV
jgi:hypothetical protein